MSKIEQLIKQHCPVGVEYKQLKEVCSFRNGFAVKSGKFGNVSDLVMSTFLMFNKLIINKN